MLTPCVQEPLLDEDKERIKRILGPDAHDGSPSPGPESEEDDDMDE